MTKIRDQLKSAKGRGILPKSPAINKTWYLEALKEAHERERRYQQKVKIEKKEWKALDNIFKSIECISKECEKIRKRLGYN